MARRSNKFTIHVSPMRTSQNVVFRTTGRFGKTVLSLVPIYDYQQPLAPATDAKAYWTFVLTQVQAKLLSL
jgi:hypothetical protein